MGFNSSLLNTNGPTQTNYPGNSLVSRKTSKGQLDTLDVKYWFYFISLSLFYYQVCRAFR